MGLTFSETSTTDEVIAGIDLSGKIAVVTGASAGLGVETARTLAGAGAEVILMARDEAKVSAVVESLRRELPSASVEHRLLDLADLASVRAAASDLLEEFPRIDLLINNAGVMACPQGLTADGFELQFGTNHLGHFLFTCLLVPALLRAVPARVVNLSSRGHQFSDVDFEDPNFARRDYDKWIAYGQSKTANVLFSVALNRRLAGRGVTANAVHPGAIVTELGRYLEPGDIEEIQSRDKGSGSFRYKTVPQGAATTVWAATARELEGRGGLYLEDCRIGEPTTRDDLSGGVTAYAVDQSAAEKLWELSNRLIGENFDFAG